MMNLAIVVNGVSLAVPPGTVISRELETILFKRDTEAVDLTYPVDLPLTDENILALGYPADLANPNVVREFPAQLYINGAAEDVITLRILKVSRKARTASVQIIGKYGTLARIFDGGMVNGLTLDGMRTIGTTNTYMETYAMQSPFNNCIVKYQGADDVIDHIRDVADESIVTDYVFYTKADEANNIDGLMSDGLNVINARHYKTVAGGTAPDFIDPVKYYLRAHVAPDPAPSLDIVNTRYFWVPQFRLHYVLRKCWEEYGFTVTGDLFADDKFKKIVIDNSFAINKCYWSYSYTPVLPVKGTLTVIHDPTRIYPQNHVPVMQIVDFITEVSKNFNLHYDINLQARSVDIRQVADPSNVGSIVDLTLLAEPDPEINYDQTGYLKGYQFSFDDVANAEVKDDVDMYPFRGYYNLYSDLVSVVTPVEADMALVLNENAYYQYDGNDWNFYSDNAGKYKTTTTTPTDNLEQISSKVGIPKLSVEALPLAYYTVSTGELNTYLAERGHMVYPLTNTGIYGMGLFVCNFDNLEANGHGPFEYMLEATFSLVNVLPTGGPVQIVNWLGMQQVNGEAVGVNYPMASPVPFSATGALQVAYALSWAFANGSGFTEGLYKDWWKRFADILNNSLEVDYRINMDVLTASSFAWDNNIIRIDNLLWLCRKVTEVKPLPAIATATLVRI